jgi:hypothetical protein
MLSRYIICLDNRTWANYTTQFLGVQYFVDLAIIQYLTAIVPDNDSVRSLIDKYLSNIVSI